MNDDYEDVPEGFFPEDYFEVKEEDDLEYEVFTRSTRVSDYAIPRWNDCMAKFVN